MTLDPRALEAAAEALWGTVWGGTKGVSWDTCNGKDHYRKDARAAVTAYIAEAGDGWRDIETAPKDGTKILLWPGYLMGGDPMTGWWARLARKWVSAGEPFEVAPTHWRPLPAPPAAQEKK